MQAVLFDAGNTLLHLDYPWLAALAEALAPAGATAGTLGASAAAVGRRRWPQTAADGSPTDFLTSYFDAIGLAAGLPPDAAARFADGARREHIEHPLGLWRHPAPDAQEVLAGLAARGLRLGVVSNADGRVEGQLAAAGLRPQLQVVVDSHLAGVEKPDPAIFRIALARLGTDAEQALYVGDLLAVDVVGAQAAGMRAILYDPWDAYGDLRDGRIRSLRELLGPAFA